MKKLSFLTAALILLLLSARLASATPLRVGLVVSGSLGDQSFFDSCNRGLEKAVDDFGISARVLECKQDPTNYLPYLAVAGKNFDLVFAVGFEFMDAIPLAAAGNPRTDYVLVDVVGDVPGVSCVDFRENEGAFLAGALGAMMTTRSGDWRTNPEAVIGAVCGQDIPVIRNFLVAYEQGAKHINPEVKVLTGFVGRWDDPAAGKEMTLTLHARGADVVFQLAGTSGTGVIAAAQEKGFYALGADSSQGHLAPEAVLASALKGCDVAVYDLIRRHVEGTYERGRIYTYGMKQKAVGLDWDAETTQANIPADVAERLHQLEQGIADGSIEVAEYGK